MSNQKFLNQTTHNISWFSKRHHAGELQLKAPFQRNPVWSEKQKSYLIDTILRGFPVPELYIQEFTDANGVDCYIVVDGQQRLRACFEYINGDFAIDGEDSPDLRDLCFADLNDDQRKAIYGYNFVVRVLPEMDDTMLRAMFQRINRNTVALNQQELRHATYWGDFLKSVEGMSDLEEFSTIGLFTANDVRRMLDVEYVSELVISVLHGLQNKKEELDSWYKAYEKEFPQRRDIEALFRKILSEIVILLPDIHLTRWRKKSDFYSLFCSMASFAPSIPFSSDQRVKISEALIDFSGSVNKYLSDPSAQDNDTNVVSYALAVERAASDLGNRRHRHAAIGKLINKILNPANP